jgi:UDP-N-acetylglucosamine 2-epimerase (hydrolysing)
MKKKILIVTASRADYGKLKNVILNLQKDKNFSTCVFVTGMHNLKLYGRTVGEIVSDDIKGVKTFNNQIFSKSKKKTDLILAKTIKGFNSVLFNFKPNLVIIHGDRIESLACSISCILNNFLIAHIEGGEVSGTVDEMMRHAVSKLSHIHFVTNQKAKKRLLQMGENKKNIFVVGSPDIDLILSKKLPALKKAKERYEINFRSYAIAILHPVTTDLKNLEKNAKIFFSSLKESGRKYVIIYPNNDIGNNIILNKIYKLKKNKNFRIFPSIRFEYFLTLLKNADFIIGNSSSGIMEAPYYGTPTINLGNRQHLRAEIKTINNLTFNKKKILAFIKKNFFLRKKIKIFGTGNSSSMILNILKKEKIYKTQIQKVFCDLQ